MPPLSFPGAPLRAIFGATLLMAVTGCDPAPQAGPAAPPNAPGGYDRDRIEVNQPAGGKQAGAGNLRQRQMEILDRIRKADPQGHTIERALINEQNELGLILDRSVQMDSIKPLMRTMLTQMAKEFPGEDLTVIAYAPTAPPKKIGTARLDARTRDMTYTPEA